MRVVWNSRRPKIRVNKVEPFRLGDEIPKGYFTEAELADLASKGKVKIIKAQVVNLGAKPAKAEPEKVELEGAETEEAETEPKKSKKATSTKRGKW